MNDRGLIAGVAGRFPNRHARIWDTSQCFGGAPQPRPDAGDGKAW